MTQKDDRHKTKEEQTFPGNINDFNFKIDFNDNSCGVTVSGNKKKTFVTGLQKINFMKSLRISISLNVRH